VSALLAALLPNILPAISALVVAGLGYLTTVIQKKLKAESAWSKLANIGVALVGKAWDRLGPEVQKALADGKITAEERAAIEEVAMQLLDEVADKATIEDIAKAVGLPVPGIIAWLVSGFIDRWVAAHDPRIPEASPKAFPVAVAAAGDAG
jgi:hypothetical protein